MLTYIIVLIFLYERLVWGYFNYCPLVSIKVHGGQNAGLGHTFHIHCIGIINDTYTIVNSSFHIISVIFVVYNVHVDPSAIHTGIHWFGKTQLTCALGLQAQARARFACPLLHLLCISHYVATSLHML